MHLYSASVLIPKAVRYNFPLSACLALSDPLETYSRSNEQVYHYIYP